MIFYNYIGVKISTTVPVPAGQTGIPWQHEGPGLPMFVFFCFYVIICFCMSWCSGCKKRCRLLSKDDCDFAIDEQLGNFFETLPEHKRKLWLATEVYNSKKLGMKMMGEGSVKQLQEIKGRTRVMKNAISYRILMNEAYRTKF